MEVSPIPTARPASSPAGVARLVCDGGGRTVAGSGEQEGNHDKQIKNEKEKLCFSPDTTRRRVSHTRRTRDRLPTPTSLSATTRRCKQEKKYEKSGYRAATSSATPTMDCGV